MANNIQSPTDFDVKTMVGKVTVAYKNLLEIEEGSPLVGLLLINGKFINNYLFSGPFLFEEQCLYVPAYVKKETGWGFRLAKVDVVQLTVKVLTDAKDLVFLDKIENGRVYYFEDLYKTKSSYVEV